MKPLTTHEEFCLKNAAHFVAPCGWTPSAQQFAMLPEAQAFGASIGDGRIMIYAVTPSAKGAVFCQGQHDRPKCCEIISLAQYWTNWVPVGGGGGFDSELLCGNGSTYL